jgi:uncharacterized protein YndB with AHSA1/START domain
MDTTQPTRITVETIVNADAQKTWRVWTEPTHIMQWTFANNDWHAPKAENDLRTGGRFMTRMEAKDGSFGFDFGGVYDAVEPLKHISYTMGDGRKVWIDFTALGTETKVTETFEAETQNPIDMQQAGWQAIMDNFKKHCEATS